MLPSSRGAKMLDQLGIRLKRCDVDKNSWKIAPSSSQSFPVEHANISQQNKNEKRELQLVPVVPVKLLLENINGISENNSKEKECSGPNWSPKNNNLEKIAVVNNFSENILIEEVRDSNSFLENDGICQGNTTSFIENKHMEEENTNPRSSLEITDIEDENTGFSDDSIADPNYESDSTTSHTSIDERVPLKALQEENVGEEKEERKRSRKRKKKPEEWKRNKTKVLRNSGKEYKTLNKGKVIQAKQIKPPCGETCKFKCVTKFSEEERGDLFSKYWSLGNVEKQRAFISMLMQEVAQTKTGFSKKRTNNNAFYFKKSENMVRVCKLFFVSTLGITNRCIRCVISKRKEGSFEEKRGKHGNQRKMSAEKIDIRNHIKSIPKIESHYVRAHSEKEYIEGGKTIVDLYRDYKKISQTQGKNFASLSTYRDVFNYEFNLSFFVPKKDQCLKCVAYENATEEEKKEMEIDYLSHQHEKTLSRTEKQSDKDKISESYQVTCFDLEATLPLPKGDVSTFYYKSKLSMYNFTVCDLTSKGQGSVFCFMWHEGQGKRGPNEIGSCLLKYLKQKSDEYEGNNLEIVFYSDNCSGQQKNKFVLAAYFYAIATYGNIKSITHKYLVTGHTQNEGDNVHSLIEKNIKRALKSGPISTPEQYVTLVQSAKKTGEPYKVIEMDYDDFFDIKKLTTQTSFSFSKDSLGESVKFSEGCVFKVDKDNLDNFYYKTSFAEPEFKAVNIKPEVKPIRKNLRTKNTKTSAISFKNVTLEPAYKGPLEISKKKYDDLMDLLRTNAIHKRHAYFYQSLKAARE